MHTRRFKVDDAAELRSIFFNTIRNVCSRDYSVEQVCAWAPHEFDPAVWRSRIEAINPFVCILDNQIAGYADVQTSGYIDHCFVHHERQGQGVGTLLFEAIEFEAKSIGLTELFSNVSITGRPFFESRGFKVVEQQQVQIGDVSLTNFRMSKAL